MQQVQSSEIDNEFEVVMLTVINSVGNKRRSMITINVGKNGVPTRFQIDSVADCCVHPRYGYVRVTGDESLVMVSETSKTDYRHVHGYTREKASGPCKLSVVRKGDKHRFTLNVLQSTIYPDT